MAISIRDIQLRHISWCEEQLNAIRTTHYRGYNPQESQSPYNKWINNMSEKIYIGNSAVADAIRVGNFLKDLAEKHTQNRLRYERETPRIGRFLEKEQWENPSHAGTPTIKSPSRPDLLDPCAD